MRLENGERRDGRDEEKALQLPLTTKTAIYIAAEANLEVIGYFDAGYKRRYPGAKTKNKSEGLQTVPVEKRVSLGPGREIRFVPTAKYGYPNTEDLDLYRGFLRLCDEQARLVERIKDDKKTFHPRLDLPIKFSTRKLLRYAGREKNEQNWKAIRDWIKRQTGTLIEGAVYLAKQKSPVPEFTGVLFQMSFSRGEKMKSGEVAEMNYVWPSGWFLSNYYYRYVKPIDHTLHQSLDTAIAKAFYPILDQGWYAAGGKLFSKRYSGLTTLLAIPAFRHLSRIKQQLDPAHLELQRERFLEQWAYRKTPDKLDYIITWWPGAKFFEDQKARLERRQLAEQIAAKPQDRTPTLSAPKEVESNGGAGDPVATSRVGDPEQEARRELMVQDITEVTRDGHRSRDFYQLLAQKLDEQTIRRALSETKAASLRNEIKTNPGAYFTSLVKRYAGEQGISADTPKWDTLPFWWKEI